MLRKGATSAIGLVTVILVPTFTSQTFPQAPNGGEASAVAAAPPSGPSAKLDGYVELNYSYNFGRPENGVTNYRGFDNRHDSFTLSNAMLGATVEYQSLSGRI